MRVVLTGASGQLGSHVVQELVRAGHAVFPWSHTVSGDRCGLKLTPVDVTDEGSVHSALAESDPEVVVHAAAMATAEEVRKDPQSGRAVNVEGTRRLLDWCRDRGRRLVFTSTDLVFDGTGSWYRETDEPRPIMAYGQTKAEAEKHVLELPGGLVARLSLLFGPSSSGRNSFFDLALAALRAGKPQVFFEDEYRTPLDYHTAARVLVRLAESKQHGVVHVAGKVRLSRYEMMWRVASVHHLDPGLVQPNRHEDVRLAEPRPADVSLDTSRLEAILPDLDRPSIEEAILRA
jgi:dTDP-4-dehydrorhamnose reductase